MGTLPNWCWMHYEQYMTREWLQCKKEGRMVDDLKSFCEFIEENYGKRDVKKLGEAMGELLTSAPIDPAFKYVEPSLYEEILKESEAHSFKKVNVNEISNLKDHLAGAWIGRIAGCLLGKPLEGWRTDRLYPLLKQSNNYPLNRYLSTKDFTKEMIDELFIDVNGWWIDNVKEASFADDDTTYTVLGMKMVEYFGKEFTANDALETWMRFLPIVTTCTAERYTYRNAAKGLLPPQTAIYQNPYREYIGAQIRADFFGYVNVGDPLSAAKMAFKDASISHLKNGIYGEMWVAAMIAIACVEKDPVKIISEALKQVPTNSRLNEHVMEIVNHYLSKMSEEEDREFLHQKYNECIELEWGYVLTNASVVAHGILYGEGDFAKSICYAVQCGFDTDCNGATVGSVVGMMVGESKINPYWYNSFHKKLLTSVDGYNLVSVEQLVEKTIELINKTN